MAGTVTVTGKYGPGLTATAEVLSNVSSFTVETDKEILTVVSNGVISHYDITAVTTITCTVTGSTYALTLS